MRKYILWSLSELSVQASVHVFVVAAAIESEILTSFHAILPNKKECPVTLEIKHATAFNCKLSFVFRFPAVILTVLLSCTFILTFLLANIRNLLFA